MTNFKNFVGFIAVMLLVINTSFGQIIFQEGFEGSFPPTGWKLVNNGTGNSWTQNTTAAYAYQGAKSMLYGYSATNAADAWAFTPKITLPASTVRVSLYVRVRSATYPENLQVTVGTDATVASQTTTLIDSSNLTGITYKRWDVVYTPPSAGSYVFGFNCYSDANMWNLYVDNVSIEVLSSCNGKPSAGTISGPSAVCQGSTFTLSDTTASQALGVTYQWQNSSDKGATWSSIAGDTTLTITDNIADTTLYRLIATCSTSGDTSISKVFKVGLNSAVACAYCSPDNGTTLHSSTAPSILSVGITGTSLSNATTVTPANGYTLFSSNANTTATLTQAQQYNLVTNLESGAIASVWFDWNQDGNYDASEWTQIVLSSTGGAVTTSITVPSSATVGQIGMRIRTRASGNPNGDADACTTFGSGETEEYLVTVVAGITCTGKPSAGIASAPTAVCNGATFTLTDSTASTGVGLSYQWQSSNDNGVTWTDVTDDTAAIASTTIGDSTWFRFKATCTSSGQIAYSNIVKVGLNPAFVCAYCSPDNGTTLHNATGPNITSVAITGTTLNNADPSAPTSGYTLFPATATLTQANKYSLVTNFEAGAIASVWFDWNQDGNYDATEWTQISTSTTGTAITTQITVPSSATIGQIGMRIRTRSAGNPNGDVDACTSFGSGETEEYVLTIAAGLSCNGKPNAGIATAPSSACNGATITLSDSAYSTGVGIAYQWQSSTDKGVTWTDITDDTTAISTYVIGDTTWFRFKATCTNTGDVAYSNIVKVGLNPALACSYCSPDNGTTLHNATGPNVTAVAITGNTLNSVDPNAPTNGYTLFPVGGSTTATLTQAKQYSLVTNFDAGAIASVWFDWNQDGNYDASEWTQITLNSTGSPTTTAITVPATASVGQIGMRIRARSTGNPNGDADACTSFGSGETEEYIINIAAGVNCTGKPLAGIAYAPSAVCNGATFIITDSSYSSGIGISYQWQSSTDKGVTWIDLAYDTTATVTATIGDTTWFRFKASCNNTGDTAYSNIVKVGLNAAFACAYCSPNNGTTLHGATGPTIDAVSITGTTLSNVDAGAPTDGYTLFPPSGKTTASLKQFSTYEVVTNLSDLSIVSIWFDWNQDGVYDASEWTQITTSGGPGVVTTPITVPATATLGQIGMRIRSRASGNTNGDADACTTFGSGETEEYLVTIVNGGCTTAPTAGYIYTSTTSVKPGTFFTITDTGAGSGGGIVNQWQYTTNGITWINITGVGVNQSVLLDSISKPTTYRYITICTATNDTASSNLLTIGITLPVSFSSFKGEHKGNTNLLSWSTAFEQSNRGFEVLKSSDGIDFKSIGFVNTLAENGNSNRSLKYEFADANPLTKTYYQLRQVDKNGKQSYSSKVLVKGNIVSEIALLSTYPNPVKDVLNLVVASPVNGKVTVVVTDLAGKLVKKQDVALATDDNFLKIDMSHVVSGNYLVKVVCENGCQSAIRKVFKQ